MTLETGTGDFEQRGGQGKKRHLTPTENRAAKVAKTDSEEETGENRAAVRVKTETIKDEDEDDTVLVKAEDDENDTVLIKEVHAQRKSRKEKRREWAIGHLDTLSEHSRLNSKGRRHLRRMLAVVDRDLGSGRGDGSGR